VKAKEGKICVHEGGWELIRKVCIALY